ncbi:GMC family oxidoreductase, partial [Thioclava sp. BHET1]
QLGAFTRSGPEQAHANLEYHIQPLSLEAFGENLHPFPAMTVSVCNLNPTSRGRVRIRSAAFDAAPEIAPNYLSTAEDRSIAAASLRQVREIVSRPAFAKYRPEELKPGLRYQSEAELAHAAGDVGSTIFHPVGTVRMGAVGDDESPLDPHLRLKGV